ncbi:DUF3093 domain-containing protein [Corynebacterium ulceribovis]|uniref:DUF3093 domain-containing protein n=1 Tax=Corynebacterium ulceribovis TaxID=487732 RepID=UPI00039E592D|nr:DUF3093 domain-containing protein [Corynebacterium ulceribovis]
MKENSSSGAVLYSEQLRTPWYWWLGVVLLAGLIAGTMSFNRDPIYPVITFVVVFALAAWFVLWLGRAKIQVVERGGQRYLIAPTATLPASVVSRSMVIPPTAKQAAMGRQLDPLAHLVVASWIPEMAMLVIDDPADRTPYWLVSSRNPQELLNALIG